MKFATAVGYLFAIISSHQSEAVVIMTGSLTDTRPKPAGLRRKLAIPVPFGDNNVGCGLATLSGSARRKLLEGVTADGSTNYFFMKKNSFTDEYCNTEAGCAVAMSLIKSRLCNTAEAYGDASTFSVDPDLFYATTKKMEVTMDGRPRRLLR
jgi:hypothetical protein